ncbi:heparinase II/III family protein [Sneathiella sp.]|jgi:uncharacterized heparinase superfamily protein|uniref:heparinase II/III family protein n=1 Tax=Sneathiella sp. TaxID=1964365 RepID=UPI0039E43661
MNNMAAGFNAKTLPLPSRRSLSDRLFSSSLYQASLRSRTPRKLRSTHVDVLPGRGEKADSLFQGHFEFAGFGTHVSNAEPWFAPNMPLHWHQELHRFSWIRDFAANDTDAAKRHARTLLISWVKNFGQYTPYVWDKDVLPRRLINWIRQATFLMTSNDGDFNYQFLKTLREQFKHLTRLRRVARDKTDMVEIDLALYLCACAFPDTKDQQKSSLRHLLEDIDLVILADGCHLSRNPRKHLDLLADLVALKHDFMNLQQEVPQGLMGGIDRLAPVVRFFQHGDGSLALFNGATLPEKGDCDHLLAISDAAGRPPHRCPLGGFERLKAGRSLLILETGEGGRPKNIPYHAGIGSFEFSFGQEKLIVNCGSHPDSKSAWGKALMSTAAHSTLSIRDLNAQFPAPDDAEQLAELNISTHEEGGSLWLDFDNPGFLQAAKIRHSRKLFLESSGISLRGEDTVSFEGPADKITEFEIRFHLHPDLSVSKNMNGNKLLIRTQNGSGWQFLSSLSEMSLEESVYCGQAGELRKSQQIVLNGKIHGQETLALKWAFALLGESEAETDTAPASEAELTKAATD